MCSAAIYSRSRYIYPRVSSETLVLASNGASLRSESPPPRRPDPRDENEKKKTRSLLREAEKRPLEARRTAVSVEAARKPPSWTCRGCDRVSRRAKVARACPPALPVCLRLSALSLSSTPFPHRSSTRHTRILSVLHPAGCRVTPRPSPPPNQTAAPRPFVPAFFVPSPPLFRRSSSACVSSRCFFSSSYSITVPLVSRLVSRASHVDRSPRHFLPSREFRKFS